MNTTRRKYLGYKTGAFGIWPSNQIRDLLNGRSSDRPLS